MIVKYYSGYCGNCDGCDGCDGFYTMKFIQ